MSTPDPAADEILAETGRTPDESPAETTQAPPEAAQTSAGRPEERPVPDGSTPGTVQASVAAQAGAPPITGVPSIDTALSRVDGLDGAPLGDHAAVYEQAHADLRGALDGPRDDLRDHDTRSDAPAEG